MAKTKNVYEFIKKLDSDLCQADRVQLVKDILYTREGADGNKYLDEYLEKYFDTKFNANPNMEEKLSHDNNVCKALESMANFILFADDAPRTNKIEYNFFTVKQLREKFGKKNSREIPISELVEEAYNGIVDDNIINFIIRRKNNYKKSKDQVITSEDLKIEVIKDYEEFRVLVDKKKKEIIARDPQSKKLKTQLIKTLTEVKSDQILCKDQIKGTIYFKAPLHDSVEADFDLFDYLSFKHVKNLLSCSNSDMTTYLGCINKGLWVILDEINLDDTEKKIIKMLRADQKQENIAKILNCDKKYVKQTIGRICNRIIKHYFQLYEEWYYTFICKGSYKRCSKCGEIKLISKFGKHPSSNDKLYPCCKSCR